LSPFEHFAVALCKTALEVRKFLSNLSPIDDIVQNLLNGEDEIAMWVQGRKLIECYNTKEEEIKTIPQYLDLLSPYVKQFILNGETK
jgi:hypothetical protein